RVEGFVFEAGGYVNLTQDHLDFHGTFERYAAAKRRLFEAGRCRHGVMYTDDPRLSQLSDELKPTWGSRLMRVGRGEHVDMRLHSMELGLHETSFTLGWRGRTFQFRTQLLGEHNVANWLVALGLLAARGVALDDLVSVV